ncbi:MAG: hypothetical protein NTZ16_00085 [Verrucomicrobia bacterium]|nr:hypothetical protein [Verrucomicrobiota bacterium]
MGKPLTLEAAFAQLKIDLRPLVALCGYWSPVEAFQKLREENGFGVWHEKVRRHKAGEPGKKGSVIDGVRHDDNTYANTAVKQACGFEKKQPVGYETCHIWPKSTYDIRYHTCLANLVLLPRTLAGISDHYEPLSVALRYRAFELYGWKPEEQDEPIKPEGYPLIWSSPVTFTTLILDRIRRRTKRI